MTATARADIGFTIAQLKTLSLIVCIRRANTFLKRAKLFPRRDRYGPDE
jgi:hypothetical protein